MQTLREVDTSSPAPVSKFTLRVLHTFSFWRHLAQVQDLNKFNNFYIDKEEDFIIRARDLKDRMEGETDARRLQEIHRAYTDLHGTRTSDRYICPQQTFVAQEAGTDHLIFGAQASIPE